MARKRLNKNLVVVLTLCAFLMILIVSAAMLRQLKQGDPKHFVALAKQFEEKAEWEQAALFYFKAWENSGDATHLVRQGEMLLSGGDVDAALYYWRQALVNDPKLIEAHVRHLEVLLELARLYGGVDQWNYVHESAKALVAAGSDAAADIAFSDYANGLALINLASQAEGNVREGLADLEKAVELAPDEVDYSIQLASAYVRQQQTEKGEDLFRDLSVRFAAEGERGARAQLAYATYMAMRWARGQEQSADEADTLFKRSMALAKDVPDALEDARRDYAVFLTQRWARLLRNNPEDPSAQELFDQSEALLKQCIESDPNALNSVFQLATIYRAARRHKDVVEISERRLGQEVSHNGIEGALNKIRAFRLMLLACESCVSLAVEVDDALTPADREDWLAKADQYRVDAAGEFPNHPDVLSQSGRIKLARGQDRAALDDLRQADEGYRASNLTNWENTLVLARLHLKLDEPGAARAVIEGMGEQLRGSRGASLSTVYAEALVRTNDLGRASTVIDRVLLEDPDNVEARRLKAAMYASQGRTGRAEPFVDSPALRADLQARELILAGNVAGAVEVRRRALAHDPANTRLVGAIVNDLLSLDRADEAQEVLAEALKRSPDNTFLKKLVVVASRELSEEQRRTQILEIISAEDDAYQRSWDLTDYYARHDNPVEAIKAIDEAERHLIARDTPMARNATSGQHRVLLEAKMRLAAQVDDSEALDEARRSAAKHNVDGAGGKTILGLYHLHRDELDLAISALREAVQAQPTDARSLARLGQCLQLANQSGDAQQYFEQAIRVNPAEAQAHRGLAILAKARGEMEIFERELGVCKRLLPEDAWVKAELLAREENADPTGAIARREAMLAGNPNDRANLHRLARLCEIEGDQAKADDYWDRLRQTVVEDPDPAAERTIVIGAAKYYRRTGRPDKSLELVTRYVESRDSVEEKANAWILVAAHYLSRGDTDKVKSTLLSAHELAPTFEICYSIGEFYLRSANIPDEACGWFDRAVELARASQSPQLKRVLVTRILCVLRRDLDDTDTARRYVDELLADYPGEPEGYLLVSQVNEREGLIDEAVDALSSYLEARPEDVSALHHRAQHYVTQGRIAAAIDDLETVKRLDLPSGSRVASRILLARLYLRATRPDAWLRELESLVDSAPESVRAVEELVEAYIHEGLLDKADRLVTTQINRADDSARAQWFQLRGRISLALKDCDRALAEFQRGAEISDFSADAMILVLDAFSQCKRPGDGVAYYQRYAITERLNPALVSRHARLLAEDGRKAEAVGAFRRAMHMAADESGEAVRAVTADLVSVVFAPAEALELFATDVPEEVLVRANDRILVRIYRMLDRPDDAMAKLDQLVSSASTDVERADLLVEQAELFQIGGEPQRARDAYERALEQHGDNWIILNNLAYVLSDSLNDNAAALPYAKRAAAIADTPATLDTLGWIYVGLEQYPAAVAELSRAIRLDPGLALAYYHLGEAYRRGGQFLQARRVFDQGRSIAGEAEDVTLTTLIDEALVKTAQRDGD